MNVHPVGTFIVTPPTLYSKLCTGVVPMAPACACGDKVRTSAPAAESVVARRDAHCVIMRGVPLR
ncbi:hypothetical protein [Streptomyces sp. NPDC090026]|uniref:hypothetical protein n=1 Tax=Streptomyces sp. NPDC090026 TaxID=3365923 RepID=UPI0038105E1A